MFTEAATMFTEICIIFKLLGSILEISGKLDRRTLGESSGISFSYI